MEVLPNLLNNFVKEEPDLVVINDDLPSSPEPLETETSLTAAPATATTDVDENEQQNDLESITSKNNNNNKDDDTRKERKTSSSSSSSSSSSASTSPRPEMSEEIQVEPVLEYFQNGDDATDDYSTTTTVTPKNSQNKITPPSTSINFNTGNGFSESKTSYLLPRLNRNFNHGYQPPPLPSSFRNYVEPEENFISIDDLKAKPFLCNALKGKERQPSQNSMDSIAKRMKFQSLEKNKDVVVIDDGDDESEENINDKYTNKDQYKQKIEPYEGESDDDDVILIESDDDEDKSRTDMSSMFQQDIPSNWRLPSYEQNVGGNDVNNGNNNGQDKQAYECVLCNKRVASSYNLRRHMMIHTGERPFGCDICFKRFREFSDLKKHRRVHCNEPQYKCMVCKTNPPSMSNPTKCEECDIEDKQSRSIAAAVAAAVSSGTISAANPPSNNDTSSFNVAAIAASTSSNVSINSGMTNDNANFNSLDLALNDAPCIEGSDKKAYVCPVCDRIFGSRHNLKRHYMIHTGEKPYKCDRCDKSFREVSTLKKHMLVHTRIKLFKCTICGREYSDFATYTRHKNLQHPSLTQNEYSLDSPLSSLFGSGTENNQDLIISSVKSGTAAAAAIGDITSSNSVSINDRDYIKSIMMMMNNNENSNNDVIENESQFIEAGNSNQRSCDEYLFQCAECFKRFMSASAYKEHLKSHSSSSGNFTFQCYICKKMYKTKEKLNAHFVIHEYDDENDKHNQLLL